VLLLVLLAFAASVGAGGFGALIGVGGGLVLVPLLTVGLGVDVHGAIAVSLLGVIAVSTTASASYLTSGFADRRLALRLLVATAAGGILGGYIAGVVDGRVLSAAFGLVLAVVAIQMLRGGGTQATEMVEEPTGLEFDASYVEPTTGEEVPYRARNVGPAAAVSVGAGAISGLLGIGGGVVNVPTMNVLMGIPIRVATTTSTYMLGATAAASGVLYLARGDIDALLAAPVVIGMFVGARIGARLSHRVPHRALTLIFVVVAAFFAIQMLLRAVGTA
jgi:uncharacterized membrane protein YfcA